MKIEAVVDNKPQIAHIESGGPEFQDSTTTYNEAGVTFNEAGVLYGGSDTFQDTSPQVEYVILRKAQVAQVYADKAQIGYVLNEKPKIDVVFGQSTVALGLQGQPMGLLLALTYPS